MSQLPKGWVSTPIDNVCLKPEQRKPNDDELFSYIDIGSVDRNVKLIVSPTETIGSEAPSRARKVVNTGDILVSMTRPNLNAVAKVDAKLDGQIASTGFDVLKPVLVESDWIFAHVRSKKFIDTISGTSIGALYPACKASDIREYEIPLPPLAEQTRIVEKLDEVLAQVDTIKARLDGIPAILKCFRQSVLAAAVSGRLTEECDAKEFKILADAGVTVKTGPFGSALHKSEYMSDGVPVINPMHINHGELQPSSHMTISTEKYNELSAWHLRVGDVVIGRRGEMGRSAVIQERQLPLLCGTGSMILRGSENILADYLSFVMRSPLAVQYFNATAVGSTMVNLNQKVIKNLEVYFPSLNKQKEIVRLVDQYFAFADTIEAQVKKAQARVDKLTQSILAKAFRGELVPQDPNDEPADKLLERIALARKEAEALAKAAKKAAKK
ncbi:restriction endonuclease subunit S [Vibrio cholerae]|uniref:restriction endonuclease subunit S n=1 Tax=Vibrio cholerae TaxID=666 RepID=UPI002934A09E|nr:restriction endonuclease subunit S [Vibrio cholerae]MDV2404355.1 restriction endonuclease subunit S [Vibrio cholerae]